MEMRKILVAMSGGVDSSVAAHLLKSEGHELIGAMMKLFPDNDVEEILKESCGSNRACCTLSDAEDARAIASAMGIPFYVFNFTKDFASEVTKRFIMAYQQGLTPNPCIDCNRFMKFQKFLNRAAELECAGIATGHYARIFPPDTSERWLLKTGIDTVKDQSYVLYSMTQEQLAHTLFPLGCLKKEEVRAIAESQGFINAKKRDSQDICFAPKGNYAGFIERHSPTKRGYFINRKGKVLGEHNGIINYTIGQRKKLGLFNPKPLYVVAINAKENTVTVGAAEDLFGKTLTAHDINLIPFSKLDGKLRVSVKIRYAHPSQPATLWQTAPDRLHVEFSSPQRAITPGQAVVLYDNEIVIGGGTIMAGSNP